MSWCVFSFGKKGALSSLEMILLRVVQLGSNDRGTTLARKIILLTVSLMTYLVYAYYSTEITAKMTSRPPDVQIKSFKDILEMNDVKILVVSGSGATSRLAASAPGTAKRKVYDTMVDGNDEVWYQTTNDALEMVISEPNHYLYRETIIPFGQKLK